MYKGRNSQRSRGLGMFVSTLSEICLMLFVTSESFILLYTSRFVKPHREYLILCM